MCLGGGEKLMRWDRGVLRCPSSEQGLLGSNQPCKKLSGGYKGECPMLFVACCDTPLKRWFWEVYLLTSAAVGATLLYCRSYGLRRNSG